MYEKISVAVEASRDVQEDLEIQKKVKEQVNLTLELGKAGLIGYLSWQHSDSASFTREPTSHVLTARNNCIHKI